MDPQISVGLIEPATPFQRCALHDRPHGGSGGGLVLKRRRASPCPISSAPCPARSARTGGEQEAAEQHGGGGAHHRKAAADGAIGESLNAQERPGGGQSSAALAFPRTPYQLLGAFPQKGVD